MWILYIDRQQYWKWTINIGVHTSNERYLNIATSDKLDSWASSDIGEVMSLFSSHFPYSVLWGGGGGGGGGDRILFHSNITTVHSWLISSVVSIWYRILISVAEGISAFNGALVYSWWGFYD